MLILGLTLRQTVLLIISGIGFIFSSVWILNGIYYVSSYTITKLNSTSSIVVGDSVKFGGTFQVPLFLFLSLTGLVLMFMGVFDVLHFKVQRESFGGIIDEEDE